MVTSSCYPGMNFQKKNNIPKKQHQKKHPSPQKTNKPSSQDHFGKKNKKQKSGDASGISPRGKGSKMP